MIPKKKHFIEDSSAQQCMQAKQKNSIETSIRRDTDNHEPVRQFESLRDKLIKKLKHRSNKKQFDKFSNKFKQTDQASQKHDPSNMRKHNE